MLIFADCHGFYIREEFGGLLIGGSDEPPLPADRTVDPVYPPATQKIVTNQAYRVRDYLRKIEHVMPILQELEISQVATGLPAFTKDRFFIADKAPDYEGLYVLAACQYAGVTHGPALGRLISELIVDGETSLDRTAYQLDRFSPSLRHANA
jgi:glycine/D-amino acid oxidase-like deaminating enzyme